jgi:hypothetical protein
MIFRGARRRDFILSMEPRGGQVTDRDPRLQIDSIAYRNGVSGISSVVPWPRNYLPLPICLAGTRKRKKDHQVYQLESRTICSDDSDSFVRFVLCALSDPSPDLRVSGLTTFLG